MRVPKQERVAVNVSLSVDFYMHLEDLWRDRWNRGYTALRLREFIAEPVSTGYQAWEERNPQAAPEPPEPVLLGGEWDFDEREMSASPRGARNIVYN
jgi:hypothetical protein